MPRKNPVSYIILFAFFTFWILAQYILLPFFLRCITPLITTFATLHETRMLLIGFSQIGYGVLSFLGFGLLFFFLPKRIQSAIVGPFVSSTKFMKDIGFGLLILLIALPLVSFLDSFLEYVFDHLLNAPLPHQVAVQYLIDTRGDSFAYYSIALTAVFVAPVLEELLFRGVLQRYFRNYLGPKGAVLLASFLFALFHFAPAQELSNIPLIIVLFIFAMYLGFCYEKRNSLVASIVLHMAFNATSVLRIHFFEAFLCT